MASGPHVIVVRPPAPVRVTVVQRRGVPGTGGGGDGGEVAWDDVTDKPETFPPQTHGHPWSEITDKPETFPPQSHGHPWSEITEKPETFPPPLPTTEVIGGVKRNTGEAGQFVTGIAEDGSLERGTPAGVDGGLVFPGAFAGLKLSNNTTDAAHDIDIAAGAAAADDYSDVMVLNSVLTKRLDAPWAVGSGNGGLDTGSIAADSWYAVWLIKRSDTGVVDALFSLSATAPTLPTNYDKKRLIGWINTTSGGVIRQFFQAAGWTMWREPTVDYNVTNLSSSRVNINITVPPVETDVSLYCGVTHATAHSGIVWIGPTSVTDAAPSVISSPGALARNPAASFLFMFQCQTTAANSGVAARAVNSNTTLFVATQGYKFTP